MQTREALFYPLRGPHNESALVVGFSLGFVIVGALSVGVVGVVLAALPVVVLLGFLGRITERSLAGDRTIPGVLPVRELLGRGARLSVVVLAYTTPPGLYLLGASRMLAGIPAGGVGDVGGYAFLAISTSILLVWGVFGYVLPAAMIEVIRTESIRSMIAFGRLKGVIGQESYLVTWVQTALLFGFSCALAATLLAYDRVGGLIGIPTVVYSAYVSVHMISGSCTDEGKLW